VTSAIDRIRTALAGHLEIRSAVPLGEGADNVAYQINGGLIARCAKETDPARRAKAITREAALLVALPEWATLPVPSLVVADPDQGVIVCHKVPGIPLLDVAVPASEHLAPPLGRFLSKLHEVPLERIDHLEEGDDYSLLEYRDESRRDYQEIVNHVPKALRPQVEGFVDRPPPPESPTRVLCHNDLGAEHLLIDPATGTLSGVIDWADAAITDPARDFALVYRDLGPATFDRMLAHYDRPWSTQDCDRAVFLARCAVLEDIAYGIRTGDRRYSAAGLDHLGRTFAGYTAGQP
jgi:aminoglycoside phosphotransferase (APT) family kinase protein